MIRSYGPGKFNTIIDGYTFDVTRDGADEEASFGEGNGWYGLLKLDKAARDHVHQAAHYEEDDLTEEESDLLADSAAVIFFERSDGIVEADWFDDMGKAKKAWDRIEADTEEDEDDEDDTEDDEDEDDEDLFSAESMQEGYIIADSRDGGYVVTHEGKLLGSYDDMGVAIGDIEKHMKRNSFYPNIYYVNDHGNVDVLDTDGNSIKSRV